MKISAIKQIILRMILSISLASILNAAEIKLQETCPVMGGKINKDLYVDALGQRIYVYCAGCVDAVKKAPEAALQKLSDKGEFAESIQTICPVMGGQINKDLFVEYKGRKIYVCCAGCLDAVRKDPAKYAEKL